MNLKALIYKEYKELVRTNKIIVLPAVLIFIGILSPISAKVMPELVKHLAQGINISINPPTIKDSYIQFLKNLNQMVIIVLLLLNAGMIVDEKSNGSFGLLFSKPISKINFILVKFITRITLILISLSLGSIVFIFYTQILFKGFDIKSFIISMFLFFIYSVAFTSLALFVSVASNSYALATIFSFLGFMIFSLISLFEDKITKFTPVGLSNAQTAILINDIKYNDLSICIISNLVIILLFVFASIITFKKQEF